MDVDEVIGNAKPEMQAMLRSVYSYNLQFIKTADEKRLLLRILETMSAVDRVFFVGANAAYAAYEDTALSIGKGQTISQPSTVARMLILAQLKKGDDVLEIGTGSGWNASLIAFLAYSGSVTSVERIGSLLKNANKNIGALKKNLKKNKERFSRIKLVAKDIFSVKEWNEKYDKIIFTAGISNSSVEKDVLNVSRKLLKKNGILVCPYSAGPVLVAKKGGNGRIEIMKTQEEYAFVPLIRGTA
ncbi:methyltransferase domain-containing protein [Candidatus Pacearchaeota archaeon]|nr:methyltransferase domain-containing protein [Candidatus Pacearchaeota archaeon]